MMRICLLVVGLAVLIVMELGTPSRSKPSVPDPFEQLTLDASVPGDTLKKGDRFGMIRFGSRTEVYLPLEATVLVKVGDRVVGGATTIARLP